GILRLAWIVVLFFRTRTYSAISTTFWKAMRRSSDEVSARLSIIASTKEASLPCNATDFLARSAFFSFFGILNHLRPILTLPDQLRYFFDYYHVIIRLRLS